MVTEYSSFLGKQTFGSPGIVVRWVVGIELALQGYIDYIMDNNKTVIFINRNK